MDITEDESIHKPEYHNPTLNGTIEKTRRKAIKVAYKLTIDLKGSAMLTTSLGKDKFMEENIIKIAWKHAKSEIKDPITPKPLRSFKFNKPHQWK